MGLVQYAVIPIADNHWGVLHDGNVEGDYATKEAAFEAIATAASLSIRDGHEIQISVPAVKPNESTLGTKA